MEVYTGGFGNIMNIILIGMPGVGKSTVGVVLAKKLGLQFMDSDLVIQEKERKLLHEIIDEKGLEGFLAVEDENNILSVVGRSTYEPLCRSFKIKEESDIETIMPLIKKSFELTKINPIDVKNKLNELYYKK